MKQFLRRGGAVLALAMFLVACAESDSDTAPTGASHEAEASLVEAIGFGEALAQIRGHHLVSLELYETGDEEAATVHARHPVEEILTSVQSELEEHDPEVGDELANALQEGVDAVDAGKPPQEVASAYDRAAELTQEALRSVVGERASEASYQGSVVAALLATSAHEYEEAIGDEEVRLLPEYQDGYAFLSEAKRLYQDFATEVKAVSTEEAEEIDEAFEVLDAAMPSVDPPRELSDKPDVEAAAELIAHELEETVDAEPVEESDPAEIVERIEELLTEIEKTYAAGDAEAAAELSAEAYLENYEVIEADVIELAPEINDELEPLLGAELREQIQAGASEQEIEQTTSRARELLREALEVLEDEH